MAEHSCDGNCEHCAHKAEEDAALRDLRLNLSGIGKIFVVMSGKGGVGKSTVSVNLAAAFALAGRKVGLLDVDVHGPSIPTMLGAVGQSVDADEDGTIYPLETQGMKVLSTGFVIPDPDDPVIWRGPMKIGVIQQFLGKTAWGKLDALVIDVPPGTGDEPLSVCQSIAPLPASAVVVTTPQRVAYADVAKSLGFCRKLSFPVAGLIENMSYFECPDCGRRVEIFGRGAAEELAARYQTPVLGRIPIDPCVCESGDGGKPFLVKFAASRAAEAFAQIAARLV